MSVDDQETKNMKQDEDDREPVAKKGRKEENGDANLEPSPVVHVRHLAPGATEADLLEALQTFGNISYVTVMPSRRMGLVEFEDIDGSKACVAYAQNSQIYVCGQPAQFNYSTSQKIQRIGLESESPNHVIIMTISNAIHPINVDVINTICKTQGEVRRIAILRRNYLQAMVEFDSVETAKRAKQGLNGADIYSGSCTLKVEFAKPDAVRVRVNNQDSWDYTLPPEEQAAMSQPRPERRSLLGPADQYGDGNGGNNFGGMGGGGSSMGMGNYGGGMGRSEGHSYGLGSPNMSNMQGYGGSMGGGGRGNMQDEPAVLMVYGVDHENWNCDKLFNLLCMYGNVLKIKFMKSKVDTAMVQLGSYQEMMQAITNLQGLELFGKRMSLKPSKQTYLQEVRDPFVLEDDTPSFKDFFGSRNQRFQSPDQASRNRIVKPTNILHWYNAPTDVSDSMLDKLVEDAGAPAPTKITIFPPKSERSSTGVMEFQSVQAAVEAVLKVNHTPIPSPIGKIPYIFKLAFAGSRDGRAFN